MPGSHRSSRRRDYLPREKRRARGPVQHRTSIESLELFASPGISYVAVAEPCAFGLRAHNVARRWAYALEINLPRGRTQRIWRARRQTAALLPAENTSRN